MAQAAHLRTPAPVHGLIASFLEPKGIVAAGSSCKNWAGSYLSLDAIWKRALKDRFPPNGLTRIEYMQFYQMIQTGRCTKTEVWEKSGTGMNDSLRHRLSNCFLMRNREDETAKIYGMIGELICTIALPPELTQGMSYLALFASYVTANELLVVNRYEKVSHFHIYSRKTGEFLRSFKLDGRYGYEIVGILENPDLLVIRGNRDVRGRRAFSAIFVFDFSGKEQFCHPLDGNRHFCFCTETRSLVYCDEKGDAQGVYEVSLTNKTPRKLLDLPKWTNSTQFKEIEPRTDAICANEQMICLYSNLGEIYVYESKTGKELLHTTLPFTAKHVEANMSVIRQIKFVGRKILMKYWSNSKDEQRLACLDTQNKSAFSTEPVASDRLLSVFPFVNSFFVMSDRESTSYGEHCLSLYDLQGKKVAAWDVDSLADNQDGEWYPHRSVFHCSKTGQVVIPCFKEGAGLLCLDFLPKK